MHDCLCTLWVSVVPNQIVAKIKCDVCERERERDEGRLVVHGKLLLEWVFAHVAIRLTICTQVQHISYPQSLWFLLPPAYPA